MFLKIKKIPRVNWSSEKPYNFKPKHKKKNVENFGLKLKGLSELQLTLGIFLIFKNIFNLFLLLIKSIKLVVK